MRNPTVEPAPDRTGTGDEAGIGGVRPGRLKRRAEFLHVGKGRRWHGKAMTLQVSPRHGDPSQAPAAVDPPRFGFTLTKKVGCAVVRNRARRRLREALRLSCDLSARPGHDYVVVGRLDAIRLPFEALRRELVRAVGAVHASGSPRGGGPREDRGGQRPPRKRTRSGPKRIWPNP